MKVFKLNLSVFIIAILLSNLSLAQEITLNWQKGIGGSGDDFLGHIITNTANGYMLAGYSNSDISGDKTEDSIGGFDYWLLEVDATGNIVWQETIGGDQDDRLISIHTTKDGGYFLAGYSESGISGDKTEDAIGGLDYWIMKVDDTGQIEWQNTIGGTGDELLLTSNPTTDGGYILSGFSNSNASGDKSEDSLGGDDYWVVKVDNLGQVEWENTIGGDQSDFLFTAIQTTNNEYLLAGRSGSNISGDKTEPSRGLDDYWIVKLDSNGVIVWEKTYGSNSFDDVRDIIETADGGFILGGHSLSDAGNEKIEPSYGGYDYWIIKIDTDGTILWQNTIGGNENDFTFHVYENSNQEIIANGYSSSTISFDKTEPNQGGDDYWTVGISAAGELLWDKTLGGFNDDIGRLNIIELDDNTVTYGGSSRSGATGDKTSDSNGGSDFWFVNLEIDLLTTTDFVKPLDITIIENSSLSETRVLNNTLSPIEYIAIYDISGRKINTYRYDEYHSVIQLNTAHLNTGTYLIKVVINGASLTKKFVKK